MEVLLNPKVNRERMTQIIFETFNVHAMYMATQTILSLYASGWTTGFVMDSGDGVSHTLPSYEDYVLLHTILRLDLVGRDFTEYLLKILTARVSFTPTAEREFGRDVKEYFLHCVWLRHKARIDHGKFRHESDLHAFGRKHHHCRLRTSYTSVVPALFHRYTSQRNRRHFLPKCDVDIRKNLYANVLLSGGTTMFQG